MLRPFYLYIRSDHVRWFLHVYYSLENIFWTQCYPEAIMTPQKSGQSTEFVPYEYSLVSDQNPYSHHHNVQYIQPLVLDRVQGAPRSTTYGPLTDSEREVQVWDFMTAPTWGERPKMQTRQVLMVWKWWSAAANPLWLALRRGKKRGSWQMNCLIKEAWRCLRQTTLVRKPSTKQ